MLRAGCEALGPGKTLSFLVEDTAAPAESCASAPELGFREVLLRRCRRGLLLGVGGWISSSGGLRCLRVPRRGAPVLRT
ncbi:hypothetical protein NDU88_005404 [Pleurodeles waltl]|uniref:Uncharacterized protein n=1 Tax=Pleurodeles waltl TaxID=8319 RepID=A0AAV7SLJ9_PLEWA|nr:hypothetical protein NDU88_005404 [Pleurodeles waltl]